MNGGQIGCLAIAIAVGVLGVFQCSAGDRANGIILLLFMFIIFGVPIIWEWAKDAEAGRRVQEEIERDAARRTDQERRVE